MFRRSRKSHGPLPQPLPPEIALLRSWDLQNRDVTEGEGCHSDYGSGRWRRFRQGHCGNVWSMKKWGYALFGWVAWKVTKRYVRRKMP
jgi:hypothetical protein